MGQESQCDEQNRQLAEAIALAEEIVRRREAESHIQADDARPESSAQLRSYEDGDTQRQRRNGRKRVWRIVNVVCVSLLVVSLIALEFYFFSHSRSARANRELRQYVDYGRDTSDTENSDIAETDDDRASSVKVDFDSLISANPDICAWLYIPGTDVDYPVLSGRDNSYYLSHDAYGRYSPDGAIFVDSGSSSDFTDFDTVVYGHNMSSGTMFKSLHKYEDEEFWEENRNVYVYLPDRTLTYRVFAAYRTNDRHILTYNDFSNEKGRSSYLDKIFLQDFDEGIVKNDETVDVDSRVLTLSTCCGMNGKRWLVQAVLTSDTGSEAKENQ